MGLDIYVGSLSRYFARDWHTVAAQAAMAEGIEFTTVRPDGDTPVPVDGLEALIEQWQGALQQGLGFEQVWPDHLNSPYATDQPHWLGFGGLVLLAAGLEHPELSDPAEDPGNFAHSRAFQAVARTGSENFPSLLGGVEWWLPLPQSMAVFTGQTPMGNEVAMGTLDLLERELELLKQRVGVDNSTLGEALLMGGPAADEPHTADTTRQWGVFGLAVFLELTRQAQRMQLPLLMDY